MPINPAAMTMIQAGGQAASSATAIGIQRAGLNWDYRQQREQQQKLMNQQYNMDKRYQELNFDMWKRTGPTGQMSELKKAGLNPALMYGTSGGGGSTSNMSADGATAQDPKTREAKGTFDIGSILTAAQLENIKADTAVKQAQESNVKMDTVVKDQTQYGIGQTNALNHYLQSTDLDGNDTENIKGSVAGEERRQGVKKNQAETQFRLDENDRQELMNNKEMEKIGAQITLMAKQGKNTDEITENLKKEGILKDAEIAWNNLGMKRGDFAHFILEIIKKAIIK